jgi:chorismate mutase
MSNFDIIPLQDWGLNIKKPFIVSGPCSCETEEQMTETAVRLKDQGISALRAGIWKPRTRPGMFEGIGKSGLQWLVNAAKEINLPATVEVATGQHVEDALKAGIDILWVGARTTVNPFSVQEVADALSGVDIPVMVKNPINPDLQLWMGGIERINKAGIKRIGAIHRGFSSYEKTKYRNKPMWELPIELRRLNPELPIIVDPSHICGARDLLQSVAQKAFDLDFDGLMIESHRDPDNAWSDAAQQVTPERLGEMYIARQIGEFKRDNGITILQTNRWDEIINDRADKAAQKELTRQFIVDMMEAIHQESIRHQTKIMNNLLAE